MSYPSNPSYTTNNTSWFDSLSSSLKNTYENAKKAVSSTLQPSQPLYGAPQSPYGSTGGKRRRKSKRMRGGNFVDNMSRSGLASSAAPITGIRSAQPHNLVGGKSRRRSRKHKHSKSCRSRKH